MANLTKEQYEKLKPWEKDLKAAVKNSYVHMSGTDFQKIAEIYADVFGVALRKGQMGCNTCRLNALRKLGELYLNYTEKEEKKEVKKRTKKLEVEE